MFYSWSCSLTYHGAGPFWIANVIYANKKSVNSPKSIPSIKYPLTSKSTSGQSGQLNFGFGVDSLNGVGDGPHFFTIQVYGPFLCHWNALWAHLNIVFSSESINGIKNIFSSNPSWGSWTFGNWFRVNRFNCLSSRAGEIKPIIRHL